MPLTKPGRSAAGGLITVLCLLALSGCGDDDDAVRSAGDLDKDGALWVSLSPGEKLQLVDRAKDRYALPRPRLASDIKAYGSPRLRGRIDRLYRGSAQGSLSIYRAYRQVDAALEAEQDRQALRDAGVAGP